MKTATNWKTQNGYDTVTNANEGFSLLLETNFHLLLQTGSELLLEDSVVTHKLPADWTLNTKIATNWNMPDGSSSVSTGTFTRITEQGDTRITEQSDTRISEGATFTPKNPTRWSE